jgi:hypothetical protein
VGTLQGSAQTGGQAGTGAAHTAGAAGRKQLPQQPQPVVLAARAATAISIRNRSFRNLVMFASPYCPLAVSGYDKIAAIHRAARSAAEFLRGKRARVRQPTLPAPG